MNRMQIPRRHAERLVIAALFGFLLFSVPGLLAVVGAWTIFSPQAYQEELANMDFARRYPEIMAQTLAGSGDLLLPGTGRGLLAALNAAKSQELARLLFPEDWVQAQAESLIDQFWAYFNFETTELRLVVDFTVVKTRLRTEPDLRVIQTIVEGLPVCTQQDLFAMGLLALQGKLDQAPLCRPPDQLLGVANGVVRELLRGAGSIAPDQVDLAAGLRVFTWAAGRGPGTAFAVYRLFRLLGPWLLLGALVLLMVVAVTGRQTPSGAVFWVGMAFFVTGFVTLVSALLLALWSSQIAPYVVGRIFLADLAVFDLLVRLVQAVGNRYVLWLGGIALGMTLFGAGIVMLRAAALQKTG